jgi:hypothetical protein
MAKLSNKSATGTSFHDVTIQTTPQKLIDVLGEPQFGDNSEQDKTNFDWICETKDGKVFTIYDWKYYRPLQMDEIIDFHIGGHSGSVTLKALQELKEIL